MLPANSLSNDVAMRTVYLGPIRRSPNFKQDVDSVLMQLNLGDTIEKYDIECIKPALQEFAVFILMKTPMLAAQVVQIVNPPLVPESLFSRNYIRFELKGQRNCGQQWFSRSSGIQQGQKQQGQPMYGSQMPVYSQPVMMGTSPPHGMQPGSRPGSVPGVVGNVPGIPTSGTASLNIGMPGPVSVNVPFAQPHHAHHGHSHSSARNQICYETLYQGYCPRPSCPKLHSGERFEVMRLVIRAQRDVGDFETRRGKGTVPPCENFSMHGQCVFGSQCGYQHSERIYMRFLELYTEARTRQQMFATGNQHPMSTISMYAPMPAASQPVDVPQSSSNVAVADPHSSSYSSLTDLEDSTATDASTPSDSAGYVRRFGKRPSSTTLSSVIPSGVDSPPNESVLEGLEMLSIRAIPSLSLLSQPPTSRFEMKRSGQTLSSSANLSRANGNAAAAYSSTGDASQAPAHGTAAPNAALGHTGQLLAQLSLSNNPSMAPVHPSSSLPGSAASSYSNSPFSEIEYFSQPRRQNASVSSSPQQPSHLYMSASGGMIPGGYPHVQSGPSSVSQSTSSQTTQHPMMRSAFRSSTGNLDHSKRNESSSSLYSYTSDQDPFESPSASYAASPLGSSYVPQRTTPSGGHGYAMNNMGQSQSGQPMYGSSVVSGSSFPQNRFDRRTSGPYSHQQASFGSNSSTPPLAQQPMSHQQAQSLRRGGASQEFSFDQVFSGSYSRQSLEDLSNIWKMEQPGS